MDLSFLRSGVYGDESFGSTLPVLEREADVGREPARPFNLREWAHEHPGWAAGSVCVLTLTALSFLLPSAPRGRRR